MQSILRKYIGNVVRHALTIGAGALVAKGVLDAQTAAPAVDAISSGLTEIAVAVVMGGVGLGWSIFKTKKLY